MSCFLSSGTEIFFPKFLKLRFWCLTPVQGQTKSCSLEVPSQQTHLNRLPGSFILSPLPTALSYLGKLLMGSEISGRGVREVAWEGRHAEPGLKWSRFLGKKPSSFRVLDSCSFSICILAYLQICLPACCGTPNLLNAALIDF